MGVKTSNYLRSKQIISKLKVEGLITFIHKIGEVDDLSNWRPITLLNVVCKIYAKASQHIFNWLWWKSWKSSCLLIFLLCVGECSHFTRIIEFGQVNETIMFCCLNLILQNHIPRSFGIFCLEWKLLGWQGVHMVCILFLEVKVVMN